MQLDIEQLKLLPKKERKELKRKQRNESLREFYRLRKIQKIVFWTILTILIVGGLYILMALVGYASTLTSNLSKYFKDFTYTIENYLRSEFLVFLPKNLEGLAKKNYI